MEKELRGKMLSSKEKSLKFDDILVNIKEFGLYQKRLYLLIIIPVIFGSFSTMASVFYLGAHPYRCSDENEINHTSSKFENSRTLYIPKDNSNLTITYLHCNIITNRNLGSNTSKLSVKPCTSWIYDRSLYKETVISEMNLVCQRTSLKSHGKMIVYFGYLTGGFVAGAMADVFGRKPVFCIALIIKFASNLATAFAPNYITFVAFRFLYGMSGMGYFNSAMVIGLEMVGPSKRKWTGLGIYFFWCIGELLLCLVAFIARDWRTIQLVVSIPMGLFCLYFWFIPESARWLISKGRKDEAVAIFQKVASVNKMAIKDHLIQRIHIEKETISTKSALISLCKSAKMLLITSILALNWFVANSGYHGMSLNVGNLVGDIYVNYLISVIVEIIAYTFCFVMFDTIGRRLFQSICLLIGGFACLSIIIPSTLIPASPQWIIIALAMIGKCTISAVFAQIFVYSSELYPTSVRALSLGILNVIGTFGAMTSPYISDIVCIYGKSVASNADTEFGSIVPLLIFGSSMVIGGLLTFFLPETLQKRLPESIEEAKSFERTKKSVTETEKSE